VPDLKIDRTSGVPVGVQLAAKLRAAIERSELKAGDRLPSLRDAAEAAGVNVNTVRAVYAKLEAAGVVTSEQGRGTFVSAAPAARDDAAARRCLHEEIARLEAELVALPLLPIADRPAATAGRARLLSLQELETTRDVLAERVAELRDARGEIVQRIQADRLGEPPGRRPSRRSSSTLAGARIRWTSS
jgi:DNA-binding transcriptional regulator YhcF (GntR family)